MISEEHTKYLIGNYAPPTIEIVRGLGTKLWDSDGKEYLDFASGIAVTNIGHGHPAWIDRVTEQSTVLAHASNLYSIPEQVRLAKRLVERIGPGKVLFCNSGAEANEAMIKLSRLVAHQSEEPERLEILVAENAFHGRTMGALSATASSKYRKGFEPLLPGFRFATFNRAESFRETVTELSRAIMLESIQGEGGIHTASDEFLRDIENLCAEKKLLLLLDEVQAGIGRTGEFLGFQASGIRPSAVAMAKGLGGGFPLGALWVSEEFAETFQPGSHGTTFGGSPLACSAANAVLDVLETENLIEKTREQGSYFQSKLEELKTRFPSQVSEIRGRGVMLAIAMQNDPSPAIKAMREEGLLVVAAAGRALRLLPPLTVSRKELDEALVIIERVLSQS